MRPLVPALLLLLTQVDSAVDPLEEIRRNGGSISWVLEIDIPDYEEESDPLEPPLIVDVIVDADFDYPTEQPRRSTAYDESNSFLKNKILLDAEERTLGSDVRKGNGHSGDVQTSEGSPLETKPADDVRKRIQSPDVQTESRRSDNVRGSDEVLAQTECVRVCSGDRRSNEHTESKHQEQFRSDAITETRQNALVPESEGALTQNETKATQKQVQAVTDRISTSLESNLPADAKNVTEGPDVHSERRLDNAAQGNEEAPAPLVSDNGSGTSQIESARGLHHELEDSKGTESSEDSSRREATDSRKGNATVPGSDRSITTEIVRHILLEERQMALDESQMTSEGDVVPATEVLSVRADDLQEEREVANGSKSNGPEQEKVLENRQMVPDQRQMTGGGAEASTTKQVHEVFLERAMDLQGESEVTNGSKSQEEVLENRQMALDQRQTTRGGVEATTTKQEVLLERAMDLQEERALTNGSKSIGPEPEKVLENRQMAKNQRQMTGGEVEATTTKQVHDVLLERAKDLQERREVTSGSKSNGPEQEKVLENRQMVLDQGQVTGGEVEATTTKQVHEVLLERAKDLQEDGEVTNGSKSQEKVLENRQVILDQHQMTGGGVEGTTTKQVNEVMLERAMDLQGVSEVTNGSKSVGPEREKENSTRSEETVRRTNQERNDVTKDALETTQVAARATATGLQKEEVQRQAVTTTEASQMERTGASRSAKDRPMAAEVNGVNFTEDSTSGRALNTSTSGRSLESLDAAKTEVDSSEENPAKLTLTIMDERRELLRSDAIPEDGGDHVAKTIAKRSKRSLATFTGKGVDDEGSAWEKDRYTDVT